MKMNLTITTMLTMLLLELTTSLIEFHYKGDFDLVKEVDNANFSR
jgi:hypothetical protein